MSIDPTTPAIKGSYRENLAAQAPLLPPVLRQLHLGPLILVPLALAVSLLFGAAPAIKNAGIFPNDVVLVGFAFCCGNKEALEAVIEDATLAQFPTKMAELRVDALVKTIKGDNVKSLIDSGAAHVTRENMAERE